MTTLFDKIDDCDLFVADITELQAIKKALNTTYDSLIDGIEE